MKQAFYLLAGLTLLAAATTVTAENYAIEKVEGSFPKSADTQGSPLMEEVPAATDDEVTKFEIAKSEKMRDAMDRWTRTVGYTLVWEPKPDDGDIRIATNMTFRDTFSNAARDFFSIVRSQTKFDAQVHSNGVLRVFVASDKQ